MLDSIPKDCYSVVFRSLNLSDLMNCQLVCQIWKNTVVRQPYFIDHVKKYNSFKAEVSGWGNLISMVFGNSFKMYNLPVLEVGNQSKKFVDFIEPEDMEGLPIRRGFDKDHRAFFCINALYLPNFKPFSSRAVITIFQHYSDCKSQWMAGLRDEFGTAGGLHDLLNSSDIFFFKELVHKKSCSLATGNLVTLVEAPAVELVRSQLTEKIFATQRRILLETTTL